MHFRLKLFAKRNRHKYNTKLITALKTTLFTLICVENIITKVKNSFFNKLSLQAKNRIVIFRLS